MWCKSAPTVVLLYCWWGWSPATHEREKEKEMERIRPDINYHMPFNHCFLQVQMTGQHSYDDTGDPEKKTDIIINLLVREDEETDIVHPDGSIEHRMFHVTCIPYIGYLNKFVF